MSANAVQLVNLKEKSNNDDNDNNKTASFLPNARNVETTTTTTGKLQAEIIQASFFSPHLRLSATRRMIQMTKRMTMTEDKTQSCTHIRHLRIRKLFFSPNGEREREKRELGLDGQ